jgi:hypothetical protein
MSEEKEATVGFGFGEPTGLTDAQWRVLCLIAEERKRQDALVRRGKFSWNCSFDGPPYAEKLAVLSEEVGEVAREVVEHVITRDKYAADEKLKTMPPHREEYFRERLRSELVQVAAVCLAWVEHLSGAESAVQHELETKAMGSAEGCTHHASPPAKLCPTCSGAEYVCDITNTSHSGTRLTGCFMNGTKEAACDFGRRVCPACFPFGIVHPSDRLLSIDVFGRPIWEEASSRPVRFRTAAEAWHHVDERTKSCPHSDWPSARVVRFAEGPNPRPFWSDVPRPEATRASPLEGFVPNPAGLSKGGSQ